MHWKKKVCTVHKSTLLDYRDTPVTGVMYMYDLCKYVYCIPHAVGGANWDHVS